MNLSIGRDEDDVSTVVRASIADKIKRRLKIATYA